MLKDFTVIEIRKRVGPMQMIIESKRLRFSRHVIEALEYSPFVHFLINARDKKLAIQVCREKDVQATRFSKPREEQGQKSTLVQNEAQAVIGPHGVVVPAQGADIAVAYQLPAGHRLAAGGAGLLGVGRSGGGTPQGLEGEKLLAALCKDAAHTSRTSPLPLQARRVSIWASRKPVE